MEIHQLDPNVLRRHPLHEKLNVEHDLRELKEHKESIEKHGPQRPIIYQLIEIDGQEVPGVLDGWSTVLVARSLNITELWCIKARPCSQEDLPELVADIQSNFHRDPEEDYNRFEFFFNRYSNGKGYRTDIHNKTEKRKSDEEE